MILPRVHGQNTQREFYIYAACDSAYFDQFAPALINSILTNTQQGLHLHLFNPRDDQIKQCQQSRISATWEFVTNKHIDPFVENYSNLTEEQQRRTQKSMEKGKDQNIAERMIKTYYACVRFIRLYEQFNVPTLAIDVDAVVRNGIPKLSNDADFYIHKVTGKDPRYLAGGLYLNASAKNFLTAYAVTLKNQIEQNYLYWSVDQDMLGHVVPLYNHRPLPPELINWEMDDRAIIWTAKGTKKDNLKFITEQKKYSS